VTRDGTDLFRLPLKYVVGKFPGFILLRFKWESFAPFIEFPGKERFSQSGRFFDRIFLG
jgi:hypothetical protein